ALGRAASATDRESETRGTPATVRLWASTGCRGNNMDPGVASDLPEEGRAIATRCSTALVLTEVHRAPPGATGKGTVLASTPRTRASLPITGGPSSLPSAGVVG